MRNEEINAEKDLAVENSTYAAAQFNLMTSSQLGVIKTRSLGRDQGRESGSIFFLKNAFLGLGLRLVLGLGLVSTITLTLTLKQHFFFLKKKDTPRSRSRLRVLLTPLPVGGQGSNLGSLNYGGG